MSSLRLIMPLLPTSSPPLYSSAVVRPIRRTSPSSRAVVVYAEANLFSRIGRLVKSVTNNVVTAAEDPEKLLDTVIDEMQGDLIKMRQAAAQVRRLAAVLGPLLH